MLTYIVLILLIIILLLISYKIFDKDYLNPAFISCVSYLLGSFLAMYGLSSWNMNINLMPKLIIIVVAGLLSFIFGYFISEKSMQKKDNKYKKNKVKEIMIENWKWIILFAFVLTTITITYFELKNVCGHYGFYSNKISDLIGFYRTKTSIYTNDFITKNTDISFIARQMNKVCIILCLYVIYLLINNIIYKTNYKKLIIPSIFIFICSAESLLTSGRAIIMRYFVYSLFLFLIIYKKNNMKIKRKFFAKMIIAILFAFLIFYISVPLLGRKMNSNFFEYISFYIGVSIPSFNMYIMNFKNSSNVLFGQETFSSIYSFLYRIHVVKYISNGSEWIRFLSVGQSNVYTSFKDYINDFGMYGLVLLQLISGFIWSKIYTIFKKSNNIIIIVMYSFYFYLLIDQVRVETFYSFISLQNVTYIILFIIIYYLLFEFNINQTFSKIKNYLIKK